MPPPEKEVKERKESKDKDKSKVHKLSLKGSAKLVAEFVSRDPIPGRIPRVKRCNGS